MTESCHYNDRMLSDPAAAARLKEFRMRRGWTQGELARRAGISRAAVSAIEINRMVPSVAAALKLAACLECTVENLFGHAPPAARNEWAWTPHAPQSRFWQSEVDGRILYYPCEETASGVLAHDGIASRDSVARHGGASSDGDPSRTLVVAGCDPAASLLAAEYARQTGQRMIVLRRSSGAALRLLKQRRVHVAGVHLSAAGERHGNSDVVSREIGLPVLLLRLAQWEEGIAFPRASGSPRSAACCENACVGSDASPVRGPASASTSCSRPTPNRRESRLIIARWRRPSPAAGPTPACACDW